MRDRRRMHLNLGFFLVGKNSLGGRITDILTEVFICSWQK